MRTGYGSGASRLLVLAALAALSACGGGGGDGDSGKGAATGGEWTAGVFASAASFAGQCTAPVTENNWLRSWTNDLYLWYDEVVDRDPRLSTTPAYFDLLKTTATTASGQPKDRFHFTMATDAWVALAQSGVSAGYGVEWATVARTPPRRIVVAYTEPGSPGAGAGLARGAEVLAIDGVDAVNDNTQAGIAVLNAGLSPSGSGQTHSFTVRDPGTVIPRTISLQSANVTLTPVQNVRTIPTASGAVGYFLFNDHVATAESGLVDAVNTLKAAGITDLVLDIRYNGGGFLNLASELAYMIAGSAATSGRTFEQLVFNRKHPTFDPVTGQPLAPVPFHSRTRGFSLPSGQALPTLDLPRVFILTGPGTCSASESIINSLRGIGVQVIQVGSATCGKPYGFYPQDNCGTTYFSIQFKGVNAAGFGDYSDGFSPTCAVGDDFAHALGDPAEARLAAALGYRINGNCPLAAVHSRLVAPSPPDNLSLKAPWRENRMLQR